MNDYTIKLDPGSKKSICPQCGQKCFVRYIDTTNNNLLLDEQFGRCDREQKCGYHVYPPKEKSACFVPFNSIMEYNEKSYIIESGIKKYYLPKSQVFEILESGCYVAEFILKNNSQPPPYIPNDSKKFSVGKIISSSFQPLSAKPKETSFIDSKIIEQSLKFYESNIFVNYLTSLFNPNQVKDICFSYNVGTAKDGSTIFWQVDNHQNIRTGKIIRYNKDGHRSKLVHPDWVHTRLKLDDFNLQQCLFGLHLIDKHPAKIICIVESEKTAVIASVYFPQYLWLATGGKSNLNAEKLEPVKHRSIILWPDLAAYEKWNQKAIEFNRLGFNIKVSDFLETHATDTEKQEGLDLADFLLILSPPDYEKHEKNEPQKNSFLFELQAEPHPINVDYFRDLNRFDPSWQVEDNGTYTNLHEFITTHVSQVKTNQSTVSYEKLCSLQSILLRNI